MPHSSGLLNLAFPAVVANTILRRLTTDWGRRAAMPAKRARVMEAAARRIRFGCIAAAADRASGGERTRTDSSRATFCASMWPRTRSPSGASAGLPLLEARAMRHGAHRAARVERAYRRR